MAQQDKEELSRQFEKALEAKQYSQAASFLMGFLYTAELEDLDPLVAQIDKFFRQSVDSITESRRKEILNYLLTRYNYSAVQNFQNGQFATIAGTFSRLGQTNLIEDFSDDLYPFQYNEFQIYREFSHYALLGKTGEEISLNATVYYVEELEGYIDNFGKKEAIQKKLNQKNLARLEETLNAAGRFYSYLSNGKISLDFTIKKLPGTLTEIQTYESQEGFTVYQPVFNSLRPYPSARLLEEDIRKSDLFFLYYPSPDKNKEDSPWGSLSDSQAQLNYVFDYIPGYYSSAVNRPLINISDNHLFRTCVHELFHIMEYAFGLDTYHGFREETKKTELTWYQDQGELYFYKRIFELYLKDRDFSRLQFGEKVPSAVPEEMNTLNNRDNNELLEMGKESRTLTSEGKGLFDLQKYTEARDILKKAVEKNPYNTEALLFLARSYIMLKENDLYMQTLERAFELTPYNLAIANQYANSLNFTVKDTVKAEEVYRMIFSYFNPEIINTHAHYNFANMLYKEKRWDESLSYFLTYLSLPEQNRFSYYVGLSFMYMGKILTEKEPDFEKLYGLLEKWESLVTAEKPYSYFYYYMGYAAGETGDKDKALAYLNTARQLGYSSNAVENLIKKYQ